MLRNKIINPRKIITFVVFKYLNEQQKELVRKKVFVKTIKSDCKFVNELAKYFDFSILVNNPQIPKDTLIYNYLVNETRKSENIIPATPQQFIKFSGNMPKKGSLVKYSNFMRKTTNEK